MITVTLIENKTFSLQAGVTGLDIAQAAGLSQDQPVALSVLEEGQFIFYDLTKPWNQDITCRVLTAKDSESLKILRHDSAHLLAQAVQELYPETQIAIGPSTEDGFFYDFYRPQPFSVTDFQNIEERMLEIIQRNDKISRFIWTRDEALSFFQNRNEPFKVELIKKIPEHEVLSVYTQGNFTDLCRGPHMPSTGWVRPYFKLMKISGAYWQGQSENPRLQRIYGTAWPTQDALISHLTCIEEAHKRDHRRLGRAMDLFHFQEEAPGCVFWHPKGWVLYRIIQDYIRQQLQEAQYQEVHTPQLVHQKLWQASGHWEKFRDAMLTSQVEETTFVLKPMNCPCHVQIFCQGLKSYRDLPLRFSEFGSCIRYEPSGSLMGLMRLRHFVQDDGHIFCTHSQIIEETKAFCNFLQKIYRDFGFFDVSVKFSDRPKVRAGTDFVWDEAEAALRQGASEAGLKYTYNPGEGAFYGPKLEFVLKDALGRNWQCGTLQLDFLLPERLGASYISPEGKKERPVMIHRAVLGSLERFIGVLLEHYAGKLPLWLAPVQGVVATITQETDTYAHEVITYLQNEGFRVEDDLRNEKISYKIREHSERKVPYIFVIGTKESVNKTISVRCLSETKQYNVGLDELVKQLKDKGRTP